MQDVESSSIWSPCLTQDGSFTFFSKEFEESFHSHGGAIQEAFQKFVRATNLEQKADGDRLCLLDVCYGLGYNTAAALETIWSIHPDCHVTVYALELDVSVARAAIAAPLLETWAPPVQQVLRAIAQDHQCLTSRLTAFLLLGDARQTIQTLVTQSFQADAVFLDPFSPRRCPQLWTVEFLQQVTQCLAPRGRLATYSRSACVRSALQQAGLQIGTIPLGADHPQHSHQWAQGTVAAFDSQELTPLTLMEQEHLQTRAAIPYRDPTLQDSADQILARHQAEQNVCDRTSTSSWRRRWGIR